MGLEHLTPGGQINRALIVHDFLGSPAQKLYQWLTLEALLRGITLTPTVLPSPDAPQADAWLDVLSTQMGRIDANTALIAHGIGASTVLRFLRSYRGSEGLGDWTIGALTFLAPITEPGIYGGACDDFVRAGQDDSEDSLALEALRQRCYKLSVIVSDSDPVLGEEGMRAAEEFSARLGIAPIVLPGLGHFRDEDGTIQVPEIRDAAFNIHA